MRFHFDGINDLVEHLEGIAQDKRERIGKTRTKVESHELKGEVLGINEAIFFIKQYGKSVEEANNAKSAAKIGNLPGNPNPDPSVLAPAGSK